MLCMMCAGREQQRVQQPACAFTSVQGWQADGRWTHVQLHVVCALPSGMPPAGLTYLKQAAICWTGFAHIGV